jgi:hypothetical protein
MVTQQVLDNVAKELAGLGLPKVSGFAADAANRTFLIGLTNGAWLENAARSRERCEVARLIMRRTVLRAAPVLARHIRTRHWRCDWVEDTERHFSPDGSAIVLAFRWRE